MRDGGLRGDGPVLDVGSAVRVVVDKMASDELSLLRGYLEFLVVAQAGCGGQAQVYRVRLHGEAGSDVGAREFALKLFANEAAARREWEALRLHANERIVPQLYAYGLAEATGCVVSGRSHGAAPADESRNAAHAAGGMSGASGGAAGGSAEGRRADGAPAILMEFVEGALLSDLLRDETFPKRFTAEEAFRVIAPIVRFSSNAMQARLPDAHRDIKPANIVIDAAGAVRLLDFGISARNAHEAGKQGTYGYAAPEQRGEAQRPHELASHAWERLMCNAHDTATDDAHGEDAACGDDLARLDAMARQDTYSMAATLFAMLHDGRPPAYGYARLDAERPAPRLRHDAQLMRRVEAHVADDLRGSFGAQVSDVQVAAAVEAALDAMDAAIDGVLRRALADEPAQRPSPVELEAALPLRPQDYERRLYSDALLVHLRLQADARPAGGMSAGAEAPGTRAFVDALDYFNSGRYVQAVPIFADHARRGNISAMYYLGICYRDGLGGLERDLTQVALLFSQAAEQGNMMAQNAFGLMLYDGAGVPRNQAKGAEWIARAAADDPSTGRRGLQEAKRWLATHPTG